MHQQIDTAITGKRQQVVAEGLRSQVNGSLQQLGKHIAHHVLALRIVAEHLSGQSIHRSVMLPEYPFKLLFVNHLVTLFLLYIQSEVLFS